MAVTKTHPIKSTLKAAVDYICNPDKTDGKLLVSSFGCSAETADIEFAWTRRHAIDKGTNLGRHLIQAFEPGEVTPEEAHVIGMQLAKEILGGKYEFVLTTHIDKGHIHNHLIFNAVSFTDHKHYHSNKRSYHFIRRTSDRICKEHGLSVIVPGRDKGKSYIEHQAEQNGTSYKAKLRAAIDRLLPGCSDLEDLFRRLQREGYELKRLDAVSLPATQRLRAEMDELTTRKTALQSEYKNLNMRMEVRHPQGNVDALLFPFKKYQRKRVGITMILVKVFCTKHIKHYHLENFSKIMYNYYELKHLVVIYTTNARRQCGEKRGYIFALP